MIYINDIELEGIVFIRPIIVVFIKNGLFTVHTLFSLYTLFTWSHCPFIIAFKVIRHLEPLL